MPIHFSCPHCGTSTVVADRFAGLRGPCAHCHHEIEIPGLPNQDVVEVHELDKSPGDVLFESPFEPARRRGTWVALTLVLLVAGAIVGLAIAVAQWAPRMLADRRTAQETVCRAHLGRIGAALRAYHDQYGSFPPAVVYGADGRAMHSWRVLLLPFLGEQRLYELYDFKQPWNGSTNRLLQSRMPDIYGCLSDEDSRNGFTNYLAVVGDETAFPPQDVCRLSERPKQAKNKILVVEAAHSGVKWTQPQDLRFDLINKAINDHGSAGIGSLHVAGANVVLVDGTVRHLPDDLPEAELVELLKLGPPPKPKQPQEEDASDEAPAEKPADQTPGEPPPEGSPPLAPGEPASPDSTPPAEPGPSDPPADAPAR